MPAGGDRIKVDFGVLDGLVGDIGTSVGAMGDRAGQITSDCAALAGSWQGSASQAWTAAQKQWETAWSELTAALAQYQVTTDSSNASYQAGEAANTAAWPA